jgi:hypothetical protein
MKRKGDNMRFDEILNSMEGAGRAQAPEGLFRKIEQRLQGKFPVVKTIPLRMVSLAAASILLLLAINVFIASENKTTAHQKQDGMQGLVEYYGFTDNYGI